MPAGRGDPRVAASDAGELRAEAAPDVLEGGLQNPASSATNRSRSPRAGSSRAAPGRPPQRRTVGRDPRAVPGRRRAAAPRGATGDRRGRSGSRAGELERCPLRRKGGDRVQRFVERTSFRTGRGRGARSRAGRGRARTRRRGSHAGAGAGGRVERIEACCNGGSRGKNSASSACVASVRGDVAKRTARALSSRSSKRIAMAEMIADRSNHSCRSEFVVPSWDARNPDSSPRRPPGGPSGRGGRCAGAG